MMWWYFGHGMGWFGLAATLLTTALILCLLGVLTYVVLHIGDRRDADPEKTADRLLMERYARGEVDEEELERRRRVLHDGGRR